MDQRLTLKKNEKFDAVLHEIQSSNDTARILYDAKGMERAEGLIKDLNLDDAEPFVVLDNGTTIFINSIIGVNGIFKDDYTEC
ncbi:MAG: hypothetical protein BGN92_09400 [Sphingobacteriales bacterium 41-5]|nr:MAG: hypothetical protein BGN92_09400 [Sphingobacteriales bacterium 41-5]